MTQTRATFLSALAGVLAGALLIGAGPTFAAAVGDALHLGQSNAVSEQTALKSPANHVLALENTGSGRGLRITTPKGQPPLTVNRAARVENLDADMLDGYHASSLARLASKTTTSETDTTSVVPSAVPHTSVGVSVPPGEKYAALVAFTAEDKCIQEPVAAVYCYVGLSVDGDEPRWIVLDSIRQGANSTVGANNAWASHSTQWVVTLGPGNHTLAMHYFVDEAGATFSLDTRTLSVLTVPKKHSSST